MVRTGLRWHNRGVLNCCADCVGLKLRYIDRLNKYLDIIRSGKHEDTDPAAVAALRTAEAELDGAWNALSQHSAAYCSNRRSPHTQSRGVETPESLPRQNEDGERGTRSVTERLTACLTTGRALKKR